jgi:hypothetical protein
MATAALVLALAVSLLFSFRSQQIAILLERLGKRVFGEETSRTRLRLFGLSIVLLVTLIVGLALTLAIR